MNKLRFKFTLVSVLSLIFVLVIILSVANFLNFKRSVRQADEVLQVLADNDGVFPKESERQKLEKQRNEEKKEEEKQENMPERPGMSPETPFEIRYFSVLLDEKGNVLRENMEMIAAVDKKTAGKYAKRIQKMRKDKGFLKEYRYKKIVEEEGTFVIFLDCGRNIANFRGFLIISLIVSAASVVAFFLFMALLSWKIVRPFAMNYEKQIQFITDAGHEIRTPLTIIDADAEVIALDLGENEWVKDIQKQVLRLRDLTDDLIFLSKMEEGQKEVQMVDFPLSEMAEETVLSFRSPALIQNKSFTYEIEPLVSCYGDIKMIERLLSILLDNALKYCDEKGKIFFSLKKKNRSICISVYNTTQYIDRKKVSRLFDRFYRTDASRNSRTGGYGIGLSMAKAIVSLHGGKITASTKDEKSLTLTVLL